MSAAAPSYWLCASEWACFSVALLLVLLTRRFEPHDVRSHTWINGASKVRLNDVYVVETRR